jgi:hypothetical protein
MKSSKKSPQWFEIANKDQYQIHIKMESVMYLSNFK